MHTAIGKVVCLINVIISISYVHLVHLVLITSTSRLLAKFNKVGSAKTPQIGLQHKKIE